MEISNRKLMKQWFKPNFLGIFDIIIKKVLMTS